MAASATTEIYASSGDDVVIGGWGNDDIIGDDGNDLLWGGKASYAAASFDLSNPDNFTDPIAFDLYEGIFPTGFKPPRITPVVSAGAVCAGSSR